MTKQIALRLPDEMIAKLDEWVEQGRYPNRTEAVRAAVASQLRELADEAIAEAYHRGYGRQPQDEWVGEAGLELMAERVAELESGGRAAG